MENIIIEKARELAKLIQADEAYKKLADATQKNDKDTELQDLIGKFNLKRIELNQSMNEDSENAEKLEALNNELMSIYEKIMSNENMIAYNNATNDMSMLVNKVNKIITGAVAGENPDTIDTESSCTGSCSSCSGCH